MEVALLPSVLQHLRTPLSAEIRQLHAILVVDVCHRDPWRFRSTSLKEHTLGGKILFYRSVIVEMIARQVGEHSHVKRHAKYPFLRQRVRRHLYYRVRRTLSQCLIQEAIQL